MNVKTIGIGLVLSLLFTSIASAEDNSEYSAGKGTENSIVNSAVSSTEKIVEKNREMLSTEERLFGDSVGTSTESLLASLKDAQPAIKPAVSDGAIGKMFFGLGGVLILIFACSWMLKRFNINKFGMTNSLSVSGVLPIGAKEKVVVVDIEGTRLVLGVTATNITKLHTLVAVDKPHSLMKEEKKPPINSDFSEKMKKIMKEGLKSD